MSAGIESKGASIQTSAERYAEDVKRFLRSHRTVDEDDEDEERGFFGAVEKAAATAKFPVWLSKGKSPNEVAKKLGMSGVYPVTDHKMWSVLKNYKAQYDKRFLRTHRREL